MFHGGLQTSHLLINNNLFIVYQQVFICWRLQNAAKPPQARWSAVHPSIVSLPALAANPGRTVADVTPADGRVLNGELLRSGTGYS
jgi:hypothetical protein